MALLKDKYGCQGDPDSLGGIQVFLSLGNLENLHNGGRDMASSAIEACKDRLDRNDFVRARRYRIDDSKLNKLIAVICVKENMRPDDLITELLIEALSKRDKLYKQYLTTDDYEVELVHTISYHRADGNTVRPTRRGSEA